MKNLLFLSLLILLAGCRSAQRIAERKCTKAQLRYEKAAYRWGCPLVQRTDSIVLTQILRTTHDTTIFVRVPGERETDTVTVTLHDGIVTSSQLRKDTEFAYATAQVTDGVLVLHLYQKESKIPATIKDAIQTTAAVKTIRITVKETTNELTTFQLAQMWVGRIAVVLLLLFLLVYIWLIVRGKHFII